MRRSLKVRADMKRGPSERLADFLTAVIGTMPFLLANISVVALWIAINAEMLPLIPPFDPFPFGLLTLALSIEAIILVIIVLISQNRSARVAELREEVALQFNRISEQEVTKILELLTRLLGAQGINVANDEELHAMLQVTDAERLVEELEQEVAGDGSNLDLPEQRPPGA